jgi:hypothetical protein
MGQGSSGEKLRSVSAQRGVGRYFDALDPPEMDVCDGSQDFYFISTNYEQKNAALCRRAMEQVWKLHPEARLQISGAKPPACGLVPGKVLYIGFFRKAVPVELKMFR